MKLLLPLALALAGAGAGVGAGVLLRPDASAASEHQAPDAHEAESHAEADPHASPGHEPSRPAPSHDDGHGGSGAGEEYVRLGNQFIVPILKESRVRSIVVLSIDLEAGSGGSAAIYRMEPKIRDAFLTVLFDHANAGGFEGTFTSSGAMEILRTALREAGRKAVGEEVVADVLITNIVRQDV